MPVFKSLVTKDERKVNKKEIDYIVKKIKEFFRDN